MMNITDTAGYDRGFFDVFFTAIGVFVTSLAASFTMVGIMMGQPHSNWKNNEDEDEDESDDDLPFVQRFYEEFNELEKKDLDDETKKELKNTFLELETDGHDKIIMRWNDDGNRFDYWCNNKNITYLELDSCAQKYAIENDCSSLVVNYKQEYDDAFKEWIKNNKTETYEGAEKDSDSDSDTDEDESSEEDDSSMPEVNVFATFKNYKEEPINKHNSDKPLITTKKSNQFRHAGSITDYENEFVKKDDKKTESDEEKKNIAYNEWKMKQVEEKKKDK